MVTKAIENAQRKVESHNFEIRKHLLEYDDVMNKQRSVIYDLRKEVMEGEELKEIIQDMSEDLVDDMVDVYTDEKVYPEEWDLKGLSDYFFSIFGVYTEIGGEDWEQMTREEIGDSLRELAARTYEEREATYGSEVMRYIERVMHLSTIDAQWKDHLLAMDHLKEGIGLRGYGQMDPLKEYQREGYDMFADLITRIKEQTLKKLFHVRIQTEEDVSSISLAGPRSMVMNRGEAGVAKTVKREGKKVGRNDPCPCGSGRKYKKCCGKN
jgi:preprotein translocase subunit SecA